jgi:hypothetical protein
MSLLKNELCKLLSKKAAWILLLLILVNPLALIYIINTPSEEGYTIKEYSSVYRKINGLNENSALEKIDNCLNETESYGMMNLYTRVYSEVEGVFSYGEYLDEIDKKTEDVNIMARFFNNGTYAIENARKTQQAYQKLKGLTIKPVDPSGILCLTDIGITDYILLLIIFILAVSIIFQEKDNNQFKLIRTMKKGRISIMLSKIMVMIISIVVMTVILYGTNYAVARANFGIPDFTTPIQSLYAYRSCPFNLNIGSFLISYIVIKILANILIGMFFLVICAVFDSFIYVFMSGAVLVFVEILLYTKISETHYLAYLKFINIMYGIKTVDMLSDYINLNVLGHPVNTCIMYGIMWLILFMCSIIYLKNYLDVPREKKQMKFGKLKIIRCFGGHTSIFRHESYKVMIAGRALFILILFIGFVVWWNPPMNMSFDSIDEVYYKGYMDELYGPLDSEIYSKFNEEKMKYDELSDRISADMEQGKDEVYISIKYKEEISRNAAFDKVTSHLSYLESKNGWFFFDKGFHILTDREFVENRDISQAFVYIIILIALTFGIYGIDYNNSEMVLLRTTVNGRRRLDAIKGALGLLSTVISFTLIYIIRMVNVLSAYGTKGLQAPASSMEHLPSIPQNVSVLQYLFIIMAMRLIAGVIVVITVFLITKLLKNSFYAIALCILLFVLPLSLVLLKVPNAEYILLNPLLIGNVF